MKKFLTVLLVIAVLFTFSFSSAFATTTYNYAQAVQKIEDSAQALKDVAKAAYDTAVAGATKTVAYAATSPTSTYVSADAQIAVFKKEYNDYVKTVDARCKAATNDFDDYVAGLAGGRDAYENAETDFSGYYVKNTTYNASTNKYGAGTLTLSAVPGSGTADDTKFVLFVKEEFKQVKAATLKGLAEIDLTVYSTKKATASTPSDFEKASAIVDEAIAIVNGYDYVGTTSIADLAAMTENMKALYVAPEGVTPYDGLIKKNDDTGTAGGSNLSLAAVGGITVTPKGLGSLTVLDKEATATVKLAYAKSATLTKVTGELDAAKMEALKGVNALILAETKKGDKADAKKLADYSDMQAKIEAAYNDALEVIKYLIDNAETVAELGEYKDLTGTAYDGFYSGWKVTPDTLSGAETYVDMFNNASLGFAHTGYDPDGTGGIAEFSVTAAPDVAAGTREVYNGGATVSELSGIVTNANRAKAEAARLKEQILIDGTEYANIDKALEDSLDKIYRGKGTTLTGVTTTHPVDALYHYVNEQLIATAGKFVTINGTKYPTTANWDANDGLYDAVKYKEVEKITDDTEKALKAAKTKEEADAAFLAGYEKFDAVITKAEHKADFLYSTGKNHEKYLAVKAELEAYINAKQAYLNKLDVADDYPALQANGTLLTDYNSANGIFYTECFTAEELDAALAEAKAVVDGLKTEKALKEEGAAILKEIPALTKATLADKDVVMAVYDKYAAHNDYCATVGSAESINSYKIERLALDVEAAEAKAIEEAIAAIAKDGKVTVDEKAAIEALRKAYDAYMDYWVYSEDYIGTGLLLGSQSLNANKYSVTGVLVSTGTNTDCDVDDFEAALDVAEANEVINMIGKLPATGATAEQVKAATAAFEALSRDAKELVFHEHQYDKLVDLQKLVAGNVKELKIVASSKATKGAITVKWTVKEGDVTAADGFQVWKSTKMNSGYKKAFTTTKTSYKNTKGLKKGTKYYYKVRAYKVVDGKNVYSDWSNKAYRAAK